MLQKHYLSIVLAVISVWMNEQGYLVDYMF